MALRVQVVQHLLTVEQDPVALLEHPEEVVAVGTLEVVKALLELYGVQVERSRQLIQLTNNQLII